MLLFYPLLLPRPSPFCLSPAVTDYGCHGTSPDTKGTWGQGAWEAGGKSDIIFSWPSVNRKSPQDAFC